MPPWFLPPTTYLQSLRNISSSVFQIQLHIVKLQFLPGLTLLVGVISSKMAQSCGTANAIRCVANPGLESEGLDYQLKSDYAKLMTDYPNLMNKLSYAFNFGVEHHTSSM
jgi:hypothetical protein